MPDTAQDSPEVAPSKLRRVLESGRFAVTAEIGPPRGADIGPVRGKAEALRDWVTAVNITDNQGACTRLSSWAGSLAAMAVGVEPIMQLTCRDRNRIALQSEVLSASAVGIHNVLMMTGDHPRLGDQPGAKPVFDLDSVQLLWVARMMRDEQRLLSGRAVKPAPSVFLGAVENPFAPPVEFRAARLAKKVAAGAQFAQTQYVFDLAGFARWMTQVRDLGLPERCHILAGVGPILTLRGLRHMEQAVPGVLVPSEISRRLRGVAAEKTADEGVAICAETIAALRQISGVAGVHVMAVGGEDKIPVILGMAGLSPAAPAPAAPAPAAPAAVAPAQAGHGASGAGHAH